MSAAPAWEHELQSWLEPFLAPLGHPARRRMCPLYVAGLIGPGERKSLQPIAARLAPADYDQLHHFVAVGPRGAAPVRGHPPAQPARLGGGADGILGTRETAPAHDGTPFARVAPPPASALGQTPHGHPL